MRVLRFLFLTMLAAGGLFMAAFFILLYVPSPQEPNHTGTFARGTIESGGLTRTFKSYRPANLPANAPLLFVMHGSDGDAGSIRLGTGYAFERLADERGFALVYPEAFDGNWNACNKVGDYSSNQRGIDICLS